MEPKIPAAAPAVSPAPAAVDAVAERAAGAQAERERAAAIRLAVRAAKLGDDLAEKMINDGTEVNAARETVIKAMHERSESVQTETRGASDVSVGETSSEKFVRGAAAWLLEKTGVAETVRAAEKTGKVKALAGTEFDGGEFRGLSLLDLARESLERGGVKTRGMARDKVVALAFTRATGFATTSDFAVLLETTMNKSLLGAYALQEDTWSRFCGTKEVSDFRAANFYRTGSLSVLDSKNEGGEFKRKSIPDGQKTAITVATKGNIIGISRELVINDDMGALANLMSQMGRAAKLSIETDVYAALAANSGLGPTFGAQAFFHAANANISTGAAITVAAIDGDRQQMAQQKDISGNEYLNLRPSVLLVPLSLGATARVLNQAQYEPTASQFQKPNVVAGLFREVVDTPRLSGTRRYLFADPSIAPAFVVAFLEGQGQAPQLASQDGWNVDGTEMKISFDFKVNAFDPKAAITNAGV